MLQSLSSLESPPHSLIVSKDLTNRAPYRDANTCPMISRLFCNTKIPLSSAKLLLCVAKNGHIYIACMNHLNYMIVRRMLESYITWLLFLNTLSLLVGCRLECSDG